MKRTQFIQKWLGNPDKQYTEQNRDEMRDDLDLVCEYKSKILMIHILPVNDLEEHEKTTTCKCKPRVEFENGEMIVIHNSFDGRGCNKCLDKDGNNIGNMYVCECGRSVE